MRPHAVDANAINAFQKERFASVTGPAHEVIAQIFDGDCLALDEGELCLKEWENCAGGSEPLAIRDWAADQMIYGRIRAYPLCPNLIRNDLLALGMPPDDHKWVRLAIGSGGLVIVTDDIDFFDPTMKKAPAKVKKKLKDAGKGPCSKQLKKKFGIEVFTLHNF